MLQERKVDEEEEEGERHTQRQRRSAGRRGKRGGGVRRMYRGKMCVPAESERGRGQAERSRRTQRARLARRAGSGDDKNNTRRDETRGTAKAPPKWPAGWARGEGAREREHSARDGGDDDEVRRAIKKVNNGAPLPNRQRPAAPERAGRGGKGVKRGVVILTCRLARQHKKSRAPQMPGGGGERSRGVSLCLVLSRYRSRALKASRRSEGGRGGGEEDRAPRRSASRVNAPARVGPTLSVSGSRAWSSAHGAGATA